MTPPNCYTVVGPSRDRLVKPSALRNCANRADVQREIRRLGREVEEYRVVHMVDQLGDQRVAVTLA